MSWDKYLLLLIAAALIQSPHLLHSCPQEERLGLLHLNAYLQNHSYDQQQFYWSDNGERYNCCAWDNVLCNPSTGRVTELHLGSMVNWDYWIYNNKKLWLFNVTLFRPFSQLINLDLSNSGIYGLVEHDGSTRISTLKSLHSLVLDSNHLETDYVSMGALTSLRTLSLQFCFLNHSIITSGIANMRQLQVLDLSYNNLHGSIQGIANIRHLQVLDLSQNNLHGSVQGICELRNLQELYLSYNILSGGVPSCLYNLTSLQFIDFSYNQFKGMFPHGLSNLTLLESLSLSRNYFEGQLFLSSMANLSKLRFLNLERSGLEVQTEDSLWQPTFQLYTLNLGNCNLNKPHGIIPNFLRQQYNLSHVNLSDNNLTGSFPTWLLNNNSQLVKLFLLNNSLTGSLLLPNYIKPSLSSLYISSNHFQGKVPENLGFIFPGLESLIMSRNHFEGHIPTSIAHMGLLELLDVSSNNFSGELPRGLFTRYSLQYLILSDNHLQGEIIPEHMNLTNMLLLKAINNIFGGTIKDSLKRSQRLLYLDISNNNNIMGELPGWIGKLMSLKTMLVSENFLHGQIPREICKLRLQYLDLSHNNFTGLLPPCSNFSSLINLHLNKNKLTGSIPNSLSSCSSLNELDLRDNLFSGRISSWINKLSSLRVLQLSGNNLQSQIPHQICQLVNIDILDLSRNHLYGWLPTCLQNMSFGHRETGKHVFVLELVDVWIIDGMSNYLHDAVEVLAKNQYYSYAGGDHLVMSALDFSCNNLSGLIPPELGDLRQIQSLNLSHNYLSGSIPSSFSNLKQVEGLDLSYNHLIGTIPSQLIKLNFLEVFNVSFNNLSGRTPETGQFANFGQSNYLGNPGLCGLAVNKSCHQTNVMPPFTRKEDEGDKYAAFYMEDFLWSFGMTSFIAFLATVAVLSINPQWRRSWFDLVDWHILWWLL